MARDDKAYRLLITEYSSLPIVGGRWRLTELLHAVIRSEHREISNDPR
jgi:hypothetical protein